MTQIIIAPPAPHVNFIQVVDDLTDLTDFDNGVYPFDGGDDQYVVVIDGQAVNWAGCQSKAWQMHNEAFRVDREHATICSGWKRWHTPTADEIYGLPSPL